MVAGSRLLLLGWCFAYITNIILFHMKYTNTPHATHTEYNQNNQYQNSGVTLGTTVCNVQQGSNVLQPEPNIARIKRTLK